MRFSVKLLSVLALGVLAFGCNGGKAEKKNTPAANKAAASQEDIGEVLAVVNGFSIGSKEFEKSAARTAPKSGDTLSPEEKKEILDKLISDRLLYEESLKKNLDQDPKVQKVMINTLLREDVYSQVRNSDFSEEVLKAYYDAHTDDFIVPEKVQIKKILIKITADRPEAQAKALAEKARAEVVSNPKDNFKDVANKYSEDTYRRRGGDVGFVSSDGKVGLDAAVVKKAFDMPTGAVSEAFKSSEGYNVVYVANRRDRVERTFQQMKGSVLRKVKNEKVRELMDGYVAKLKSKSSVEVKQDKLAATEVKHVARPQMPPGSELGMPSILEGREDDIEGNAGEDDIE